MSSQTAALKEKDEFPTTGLCSLTEHSPFRRGCNWHQNSGFTYHCASSTLYLFLAQNM